MKFSKVFSFFLVAVLGTSVSFAQSAFEGVITYNTTNAAVKETATVTWYHKGDQNLMEFDSHAGEYNLRYSMIMGTNDASVFMMTDKGSQEVSGVTADPLMTGANFVRKMATTENGYDCEMLMFKSNGNDLTYWVTKDVALTYDKLPKLMRNNMPDLSGISNGFPIKMELRDSNGNVLISQEVTSVKETKVDPSKFNRR